MLSWDALHSCLLIPWPKYLEAYWLACLYGVGRHLPRKFKCIGYGQKTLHLSSSSVCSDDEDEKGFQDGLDLLSTNTFSIVISTERFLLIPQSSKIFIWLWEHFEVTRSHMRTLFAGPKYQVKQCSGCRLIKIHVIDSFIHHAFPLISSLVEKAYNDGRFMALKKRYYRLRTSKETLLIEVTLSRGLFLSSQVSCQRPIERGDCNTSNNIRIRKHE